VAIAVAQHSGQAWASGTSVTTTGITSVSNSLLLLVYGGYRGSGYSGVTVTPSDSKSNSWTSAAVLQGDLTTYCGIWYNNAGTRGASHTASVGADATVQASAVLVEITGHAAASFVDQAATDSQTTGTATVTTSATTNANDLVIAVAATRGAAGTINLNANGTITGSNGTDIFLDNDGAGHTVGSAVWYRIVSATGAQTASRSHDAVSSDWTIAVAAIKEAVAGSGKLLRMMMENA
jgi:hypothetical protein